MSYDWPRFRSHKVVQAAPIVRIVGEPTESGTVRLLFVSPRGGGTEIFMPSEPAMADRAGVGWYAVIYEDGYKSVSPKEAFEAGYSPA